MLSFVAGLLALCASTSFKLVATGVMVQGDFGGLDWGSGVPVS